VERSGTEKPDSPDRWMDQQVRVEIQRDKLPTSLTGMASINQPQDIQLRKKNVRHTTFKQKSEEILAHAYRNFLLIDTK
jgi:hypothetical protein